MQRGELAAAVEALGEAARLFRTLPAERARCENMLGIALRGAQRLDEAARAFEDAARLFDEAALPSEAAAARFNQGLVWAQAGRSSVAPLRAALDGFRSVSAPRYAAAAARELGHALLVEGRTDDAVGVLEEAVDAAAAVGDEAGRGAAANALGLALLAVDDVAGAVEAFQAARAGHPRSIRPDQHAMATANLALAYERAGNLARAQLAAAQARAVPEAATPVLEQCREILGRTGAEADALFAVLRDEPEERWVALFRDELDRWVDVAPSERRSAAQRLAEELANEGTDGIAAAWLAAALERRPDELRLVLSSLVRSSRSLGRGAPTAVLDRLQRAAARFHLPQMMRVEQLLSEAVQEAEEAAG